MIRTPDADSFVALARQTRYARLFDGLDSRFIEQNYDEMVMARMRKLMQADPFSIACLIGYTHFGK